jgi:hypothetical protein
MVAAQVFAGWGNHGSKKASGRRAIWASESGHAYRMLSNSERADMEKLRQSLKDDRQEIVNQTETEDGELSLPSTPVSQVVKSSVQENMGQSTQVQEKNQDLKFDLNRSGSESSLSASCGAEHPAVTGGSCHM